MSAVNPLKQGRRWVAGEAVARGERCGVQYLWGRQRPSLEPWCAREVHPAVSGGPRPGCHHDRHQRQVGVEPAGPPGGVHRALAAEILRFNVFPPWLITGVLSHTPVEVGATVGVHYHPLPSTLSVFFAARVVRVVDGPTAEGWQTGFVYQTLPGHPELGEELFCVTKRPDGTIWVSLSSWSMPGLPITRLFAPIVRLLQLHGGRSALAHLAGLPATPDGR